MKFTFCIAKKKDKDKIMLLVKKLAVYERKKPEEVNLTLDKLESHGFGKKQYFHVVLAKHKKISVGYALFFFSYDASAAAPILYVENLFVDEAYRSHGLGSSLLSRLAQMALERGCCRMEGHAFTWNKKSIDFYELLGAHPRTDLLQFRLFGEHLERLAAQAE